MRGMINWLRVHVDMRRALILYAVFIAIGWLAVAIVPQQLRGIRMDAGPRGDEQIVTLIVFSFVAVPIVMFVVALPIYSFFVFRHRGPGRPLFDAEPITAHRGQIIGWIAITVLHAMLLYAWGVIFLGRADAYPAPSYHGNSANILDVYVTGEQWNWDFTYPQYGNAQSSVLELPVDRPVYFTITSMDVVHSFSVPALGAKEDAVPGIFTHIRSYPEKLGAYSVRCYELCGTYHTYMENPAYIVTNSAFLQWVNSRPVHGYPWPINGAGRPKAAQPYCGNDQFPEAPNGQPYYAQPNPPASNPPGPNPSSTCTQTPTPTP